MKSHSVVLRAKVRAHRRRQAAALTGVALLGVLAFVSIAHLRNPSGRPSKPQADGSEPKSRAAVPPRSAGQTSSGSLHSALRAPPRLAPPSAEEAESPAFLSTVPARQSQLSGSGLLARLEDGLFRIERLEVTGAPETVEPQIREAAGLKAGDILLPWARGRIQERLKFLFPFLKSVRVSRRWRSRALVLALELKRPVARLERGGAVTGFLSEEGERFKAPADLFAGPLPVVDADEVPAGDLSALAQFLGSAAREGVLPSPVVRGSWKGEEDGWFFRLGDDTRLTWGGLSWTEEKLARLREALVGAKLKFKGTIAADLRFFEDGRILVKELGKDAQG